MIIDRSWLTDFTQLLDEHHVAVLCDGPRRRRLLERQLVDHLESLPDTEVERLDGASMRDIGSACAEIERAFRLRRPVERDEASLVGALRRLTSSCKRRYIVWRDAELTLDADVGLFGTLVGALCAVAAEREHLDDDWLTLDRVVFLGDAKLGAYAEMGTGQFRTWLPDGAAAPRPEVATIVRRPPVVTYRV